MFLTHTLIATYLTLSSLAQKSPQRFGWFRLELTQSEPEKYLYGLNSLHLAATLYISIFGCSGSQ